MEQTTATRRTDREDDNVIGNIDAATAAAGTASGTGSATATAKQETRTADPAGLEALLRQRVPFWAHWERLSDQRNSIMHMLQHLVEAGNGIIVDGNGNPIDTHAESHRSSTWGIKWTTSEGQWALGFGPDSDGDDLYVVYVNGPDVQWRGTGVTADQAMIKLDALDVFPSSSGTING